MDTATFAAWPVSLAQESAPAPAPGSTPAPGSDAAPAVSAPVDNSQAPASATEGDGSATTQSTGTPGAPGGTGSTGTGTGQQAPPPSGLGGLFLPLILVFGILMLFTMGGGRKEKKRRAQMMTNLKKGVTVQTVGGVRGTVMEVREDEVLVKVDESSNTRIRFAKSAISSVTDEA